MRLGHLLSGLAFCCVGLGACGGGDDESTPGATGGAATAGAAGSKAGSSGQAGKAGGSGAAGAAGTAGGKAGSGGASGTAGTGGKAGMAGSASGAAGQAGGGGSTAGTGGVAGMGGKAGSGGTTAGAGGTGGGAGSKAGSGGSTGGTGGAAAGNGGGGTGGSTAGSSGGGAGGASGSAGKAGSGGAAAGSGGAAAGSGGAGNGGGGAAGSPCATLANGSPCDDGDACTTGDSCNGGVCVPGAPKACTAQDQCHDAGVCDPGNGQCSNPEKPNGAACSDGDACTQSDTCQAGACVGASPVVCPAAALCKTQPVCNPQTGMCSASVNAPNLTPCDDGDPCTVNDYCIAGSCFTGPQKSCPWADECHTSTCNQATGACDPVAVPNGDPCADGDSCTTADRCTGGVCGGTPSCGGGTPTTVVISEVRSRLGAATNDEFVELYNTTGSAIDISGWKLKFSNNGTTVNTRATVPAGKTIPAYGHYLFAHTGYTGSVPADQAGYTTGMADNGGVAITTAADAIVDQVGFGAAAVFREGTSVGAFPGNNASCFERLPGSGHGSPIDTGDNSVDFFKNTACDPQNSGSEVTPAFSNAPGALFFAGLGTTPVQASTTLTNTLPGSLTLQSAALAGANAAEFSFSFASALPQTLSAGGTLVVTVTHTPTASGRRVASLRVTTGAGETRSIELMAGDVP